MNSDIVSGLLALLWSLWVALVGSRIFRLSKYSNDEISKNILTFHLIISWILGVMAIVAWVKI